MCAGMWTHRSCSSPPPSPIRSHVHSIEMCAEIANQQPPPAEISLQAPHKHRRLSVYIPFKRCPHIFAPCACRRKRRTYPVRFESFYTVFFYYSTSTPPPPFLHTHAHTSECIFRITKATYVATHSHPICVGASPKLLAHKHTTHISPLRTYDCV